MLVLFLVELRAAIASGIRWTVANPTYGNTLRALATKHFGCDGVETQVLSGLLKHEVLGDILFEVNAP